MTTPATAQTLAPHMLLFPRLSCLSPFRETRERTPYSSQEKDATCSWTDTVLLSSAQRPTLAILFKATTTTPPINPRTARRLSLVNIRAHTHRHSHKQGLVIDASGEQVAPGGGRASPIDVWQTWGRWAIAVASATQVEGKRRDATCECGRRSEEVVRDFAVIRITRSWRRRSETRVWEQDGEDACLLNDERRRRREKSRRSGKWKRRKKGKKKKSYAYELLLRQQTVCSRLQSTVYARLTLTD